MRVLSAFAAILLIGGAARAEDSAGAEACRSSPNRVGDCFAVHGRMTYCTGVPNARIWIVGTKRVLGIVDAAGHPAGDDMLPPKLEETLSDAGPCGKAAYGDFTVCPLTEDRPGVMRRVCLIDANRLVVTDF